MKIKKAIEILELHNKWRRDNDGDYEMQDPKEIGKAIDTVVNQFKKFPIERSLFDYILNDPRIYIGFVIGLGISILNIFL